MSRSAPRAPQGRGAPSGPRGNRAPRGSPEQLSTLRDDLTEAAYTTGGLGELLGPVPSAALHRDQPLPALRALAGSTEPAATLVRLLVLGQHESVEAVDAALPRTGSAGLVGAGVARHDEDGRLRATCDLRPYGEDRHDWWVASDPTQETLGAVLPTDHVLGIGGASTTLASWTPRPRVGRALDLGTGCGVQALHLVGHVGTVCATDLSERALAYARFNAGLNGVLLDLRAGSLLEPVVGERFDLVVSNPPFVITPRTPDVPRYEYRDGGAPGDAIVAGLVRDLGSVLSPGGIAQLLGNWELQEGEEWTDHVGRWVQASGLDAWVIQREVQDVAEYAETWVRDGGHRPGTTAFETLYAAWLDDFESRGIERVGFGVVTLQRPQTDRHPFHDLEELRGLVEQPAGPAILAGLRARTWLAEHTDDELWGTAWSVAPDVTEERIGRPGASDPMVIQLRQGGGLGRTVQLDTVTAALVGASDGELTSGQIVRGISVLTGADVTDLESQAVVGLRALVRDGLLQ